MLRFVLTTALRQSVFAVYSLNWTCCVCGIVFQREGMLGIDFSDERASERGWIPRFKSIVTIPITVPYEMKSAEGLISFRSRFKRPRHGRTAVDLGVVASR